MWQRQITCLMRVPLLPGKLTTQLLMNIIRSEMPILPSKRQVTGRWWLLPSRFLIEWQGGHMHQELPWREAANCHPPFTQGCMTNRLKWQSRRQFGEEEDCEAQLPHQMRQASKERHWLWARSKQAHAGIFFILTVRGLKMSCIRIEYTNTSVYICLGVEDY